jgi:hypothetical protein
MSALIRQKLAVCAIACLAAGAAAQTTRPDTKPSTLAASPEETPVISAADLPPGEKLYPQTQPAARITDPADLARLYDTYLGLQSFDRMSHYMREARHLIEKYDLNQPADEWERRWNAINSYFADREYVSDKIAQDTAEAKILEQRDVVVKTLFFAVGPVAAYDTPGDNGKSITLLWAPASGAKSFVIRRLDLGREGRPAKHQVWVDANKVDAAALTFKDTDNFPDHDYRYQLIALRENGARVLVGEAGPVRAQGDLFLYTRRWLLVIVGLISAAVLFYISLARRGVDLKIRKIAGLEAVDEAVGRATEMGRPILFVPGIQDMNEIQTVAGLIVLGRVANVAAVHDAFLEVPTSRSLVMTAARETVATSYSNAGRPDAYDEKKIYYTTDEQFAYVATVTGMMVREKPAACFYMGSFFAESLILAETGNLIGSIQIAGTAQPSQLPFFVAACDYTLIGEEFFAASAYLSGEPLQMGSLKGQDVGKVIAMVLIVVGCLLYTFVMYSQARFGFAGHVLDYLTREVLNTTG